MEKRFLGYFLRKRGCVVSRTVELKLRLRTTHPPDFWYGKRCWQYLLLNQKSSVWVVCRRRYGQFIVRFMLFLICIFFELCYLTFADKNDDSDFVVVASPISFNKRRLTEKQREKMKVFYYNNQTEIIGNSRNS